VLPNPEFYRLQLPVESPGDLGVPVLPPLAKAAPAIALKRLGQLRFNREIVAAATRAGVDPALVHALVAVESSYNVRAISPKGAVGLMQLMASTARRYGAEDRQDVTANLRAGTLYLSDLMRLFHGDVELVLAAYNAGENAVLRHGKRVPPYPETVRYVPRVLGLYRTLSTSQF
jgi:soluble lytic murein transglycosylase-like protein